MSRRAVCLGAAALITLATAGPVLATAPAAADEGVDIVNTETVKVYTDPGGEVEIARIYEQLTLMGAGSVEFDNPVGGHGVRNLDGFAGFDVSDGEQHVEADVDGVERMRSVSEYEGDLPIEIEVDYTLEGEPVEPGDLVGEDGELAATFTVTNVTAQERELTVPDGRGGTTTTTASVPVPIVGSLTTTAPPSFTDVSSDQANLAGDGKGGTRLSFTMTLFPPIGSESATFGYTAMIEDGVVPRIEATVLPVNPLESPSFKTAATSYQGGSATGLELATGASVIDGNLLRLRDGAADLLAGLLQLHEGSEELQAGLAGEAAPGAEQLADGAGELRDGLGQIDDGAGQLADGSGRLKDGTGDALSGSRQLHDGLSRISGGLDQLAAADGLPKAAAGVDELKAGVDRILAGFGSVGRPDTLIDGLSRLEAGAGELKGGLSQLSGGVTQAKGGVDQVQQGLGAAVAPGGSIDQLIGGLTALANNAQLPGLPGPLDCGPLCQAFITNPGGLLPGVEQSKKDLTAANQGLIQVSDGLVQAITGLNTQLIPGANQLATGAGDAKAGARQLKDGVRQVRTGLGALDRGLTTAVDGVLRLSEGAQEAESGSGDLAGGLGLLDAGADELADGAGQLADGTGEARSGSGRLADGAGELADGLGDAADGSGRLADGLGQAADGAPRLVDGTGRLSKEGTKVIARKGAETAQEFGELYAVLEAGAQRADAEKMVFGAPEGATGLTAYSFVVKGENGEGGRNWTRGLAGLALLGVGMGAFGLRRRLL